MKPSKSILVFLAVAVMCLFCLGPAFSAEAQKGVPAKGQEEAAKAKPSEAAAGAKQEMKPLEALGVYLDGFHFQSGHLKHAMEAHHYCASLNEDLIQCVLYDGNKKDSRLVGIEYVISGKKFKSLPDKEKKMWHSHVYEVKSGMLAAPGMPETAEHDLLANLISTYGKTWHTWNMDSMDKDLPFGIPDLMWGFTADGQMDLALDKAREAAMGISSEAKKKARADIASPPIQAGADAWQKGKTVELQAKEIKMKK